MATTPVPEIKEEKAGGPYTKSEQERRRDRVYELHFEKGQSALKIAERLGFNRNTINSDIKYWYSQMVSQIGGENVCGILLKQIERLEIQRTRSLEAIEDQEDFSMKIKLEKMITDIENKIAGGASKLIGKDLKVESYGITEEISEEEIFEFVMHLISKAARFVSLDKISEELISMKKCDTDYEKNFIKAMQKLGLELCGVYRNDRLKYDLPRFASMRGYTKVREESSFKTNQDKPDLESV